MIQRPLVRDTDQFRHRLAELVARAGTVPAAALTTGLSITRINALLDGDTPTRLDIGAICLAFDASRLWLLSGATPVGGKTNDER
jgi:hypothetical protein